MVFHKVIPSGEVLCAKAVTPRTAENTPRTTERKIKFVNPYQFLLSQMVPLIFKVHPIPFTL